MSGPTFSDVYGGASVLFGGHGARESKARAQAEASRQECRRLFRAINGYAPVQRDAVIPDPDPRPTTGSGWPTGKPGWCL
jgi:hypothetical protein